MEPLIHLNYPLDKARLLKIAAEAYIGAEPYSDPRYEQSLDTWLISRYNNDYIRSIMMDLGVAAKPRFYWTEPNSTIPEHVDYNTTCSFNFVLSDNPAPVTFGDKEYTYEQCLLNTTLPHAVYNNNSERILLKLSVFDISYKDVIKKIPKQYRV